ncbi:MAG: hypothetical protein GX575_03910 [Candidatus Anammoximicrobium sp.]|nr:hypothetical protein [Candidatus Anammoximicrobium sp.]
MSSIFSHDRTPIPEPVALASFTAVSNPMRELLTEGNAAHGLGTVRTVTRATFHRVVTFVTSGT